MRARIALRALQTSDAACVGRLLDDLNLQQLVAVFLEVARLARLRFFEGLFSWTLRSRSIICWYRGVGLPRRSFHCGLSRSSRACFPGP